MWNGSDKVVKEYISKLVQGEDLSFKESIDVMTQIMEGESTSAQLGSFLTALALKGETVDEVAGMASVMRDKSTKVVASGDLVDTCGTGGDGLRTFNISTASAFVCAGHGAKVAKHGNRAMSGKTGSADVLEALGANINLSPEAVSECILKTGFGFIFAQGFHPSMKYAAGPRRDIGIRTVFNILGPLTNPAGAKRQVIGVSDESVGELMANVLGKLGSERALIIHGGDGLDEITITGNSTVWELCSESVTVDRIDLEELGFTKSNINTIQVDSAKESADVIMGVLSGAKNSATDVVLLNAAAGLVVSGLSKNLVAGISDARASIDSGSALHALRSYVEISNSLGE